MSSREGGMVALFMLLFLLLLLLLATLIGIGHKDINFACGIVNRAKLPHLEALWACPRAPHMPHEGQSRTCAALLLVHLLLFVLLLLHHFAIY